MEITFNVDLSLGRIIKIAVFVIALLIGFVVWNNIFRTHVLFEAESISPDGLYQCHVIESFQGVGNSKAVFTVCRWVSGDWKQIAEGTFENDSCSRGYYSIDWDIADQKTPQTMGVKVWSDGEPVFKETLSPKP